MPCSWNGIRVATLVLIVFIAIFKYPGTGLCDSESEIVRWVAGQMQIQRAYSIPVVKVVEKADLNKIFTAGSKHVMARWVADHGQADADKLMNVYLDSAVGLFDPKTRIIYVGGFLSACRQKAILAHEIAHYFQYVVRGPVTEDGMAAEMILMEREIEACAIERSFEERFCNDAETTVPAVATLNESLYLP